eukprot:145721-Hanusia_phi.AAC.1
MRSPAVCTRPIHPVAAPVSCVTPAAARPVRRSLPAIGGPGPAGHGPLRHWAVNPSPCRTAIFQVYMTRDCMPGGSGRGKAWQNSK